MRIQANLIVFLMLSLFVIGFAALPVSARGSDETDSTGMPYMPWMPGIPGMMDHLEHMPGYESDDESIWISIDIITVLANREMPAFHFWYSDANTHQCCNSMRRNIDGLWT